MRLLSLFALFAFACFYGVAPRSCAADTFAYVPKSDGTIARFRVNARTGKLDLLPGATDTGIKRLIGIILSADKRFLYAYRTFDVKKDGLPMDFLGDKAQIKAASTKPNPIKVFRIEVGGDLRAVETLTVPGPIGDMIADPKGRFVYALSSDGMFLLHRKSVGLLNGLLEYKGRVAVNCGVSILDDISGRNAWWLTFAPQGSYLYSFRGTGFTDHSENYLQRYTVNPVTGNLKPDGEEWMERGEENRSDTTECGAVALFVGQTAFVVGFSPGCGLRPANKAGLIARSGPRSSLRPTDQTPFHDPQTLVRHPALPLVIYRGSFADPYTVWRVVGPGKVVKVGEFASTFTLPDTPPTNVQANTMEPGGRFFYEFLLPTAREQAPRVAVFALSASRTRAKLSVPPTTLPLGCARALVFVTVPTASLSAKGAK